MDPAFSAHFSWHKLGPDRGGRSIGVSGVNGRPQEAYIGAPAGGDTWTEITRNPAKRSFPLRPINARYRIFLGKVRPLPIAGEVHPTHGTLEPLSRR